VRLRSLVAVLICLVFTTVAMAGSCLACANTPTQTQKHCCSEKTNCPKPVRSESTDHKNCGSPTIDLAKVEKVSVVLFVEPLPVATTASLVLSESRTPVQTADPPPDDPVRLASQLRI